MEKFYRLKNLILRGTISDKRNWKTILLFIAIISSTTFFGVEQEKIIITGTVTDENSGIRLVKYPFYSDDSPNKIEPDFVEIRLAEVFYMLAECRFREGNVAEATELLNKVRRRYFPEGSESLYDVGDLNEQELLDEWGREFIGEGRRRTDLIRFGKFTTGTWWDKQSDGGDKYLQIFPIAETVLNINPQLKQNPGY